jgi:FAD binding domain-containing protein/berberine-like enzyme
MPKDYTIAACARMTQRRESRSMDSIAGMPRLDDAALGKLERSFRGELVQPGAADYDEHRKVWNGSINRSPALIARCAGAADVAAAIAFARRTGLPLAVRSGGHSFPGLSVCDGGIVLDTSLMKGISVDPESRTARVQAGVLWGELDHATQAFGLATTGGIVTHTGVAGLTLGGGIGWLQRRYGMTIDNLISASVVTASGERVTASDTENSDLFWGLRGGGGNFGVVTEFEFRLHEVGPTVLAGPIFWRIEDSPRLLRFYREWAADAPDELMTIVIHRRAPALPFVPAELQGELIAGIACCWCGPLDEGERALRPLKEFGTPVLDLCEPKPYVQHQSMFDPSYPHGWWYYIRACDVGELTDEVIDITAEHAGRIRSPLTGFPIWQLGGAVARVGEDDTAFNGRFAGYTFNLTAITDGPDGFAEERDWSRSFWSALEPHHTSVYVNFLMEEGEERIREAYGAEKYDRLKALKRRYDPDNLFRLNQNIPPG